MTFGEKVRSARIAIGITQKELSDRSGISLRTIQNYESGERLPKQKEYYAFLAQALGISEKELHNQDDSFHIPPREQKGMPGNVRKLLDQIIGLYSGGTLCEEDMDAMMRAIQDAYWVAKENNRKFIPKKYRHSREEAGDHIEE